MDKVHKVNDSKYDIPSSDTSHAWNRSGNHNMILSTMYIHLIILAMIILD